MLSTSASPGAHRVSNGKLACFSILVCQGRPDEIPVALCCSYAAGGQHRPLLGILNSGHGRGHSHVRQDSILGDERR